MEKNDNYNKYKNRWDYNKNILKWEKDMYLSVNKLIVLFQKNRVLIRERRWIVICMTLCWLPMELHVGETGRCFKTRKKEHMRNVKSFARGSNIAKHAWSSNHSIDFKIKFPSDWQRFFSYPQDTRITTILIFQEK